MKKLLSAVLCLSLIMAIPLQILTFAISSKQYGQIDLADHATLTASVSYELWGNGLQYLTDKSVDNTGRYIGTTDELLAAGYNSDKDYLGDDAIWIQAAFDGKYKVNKLSLASFGYSLSGFPSKFTIEASDDGSQWNVVKTVDSVENNTTEDLWHSFEFEETECKYLRIVVTEVATQSDLQYAMTLREIEICGEEVVTPAFTEIDLADHATLTASVSYELWGNGLQYLTDKSVDNTGRYIGTTDELLTAGYNSDKDYLGDDAIWIQAAFDGKYKVNKLSLASFGYSLSGFPSKFTIEASDDGSQWNVVKTVDSVENNTTEDLWHSFEFEETECKYLRIVVTEVATQSDLQYAMTLREIEVCGEEVVTPAFTEIDLADHATLTASVSYELWGNGLQYLTDKSVDNTGRYIGTTDELFAAGYNSDKDYLGDDAVWIQAAFDGKYKVNKLSLASFGYSLSGFPSKFTIEASDDGSQWNVVKTVDSVENNTTEDLWHSFEFEETECKYLRIVVTEVATQSDLQYAMTLREIEVCGEKSSDSELPSDPPKTAESKYSKIPILENEITASDSLEQPGWGLGYGISKLIDGLATTGSFAACNYNNVEMTGTSSDGNVNSWICYDLGRTYTVDMVKWFELDAGTLRGAPVDCKILTSTDKVSWEEKADLSDIKANQNGQYSFNIDETTCRYVKLQVSKTGVIIDNNLKYSLVLNELEVYGAPDTSIVLNKIDLNDKDAVSITASNSYQQGNYSFDNLFDGDVETSYAGISKANVPGKHMSDWIHIDLKSVMSVNKIALYSREMGSKRGVPTDFEIFVSSDDSNWNSVKTIKGISDSLDQEYDFEFDATDARYIKIVVNDIGGITDANIGYAIVLSELEVYTPDGKVDLASIAGKNEDSGIPISQTVISASRSYELWGLGKANLIDGDKSVNSLFACAPNADQQLPLTGMKESIFIDLKKGYKLQEFRFASYKINSNEGLPEEYTLESSIDGINWTRIINRTSNKIANSTDGRWTVENLGSTNARFLKFTILKVAEDSEDLGYAPIINEIELYGDYDKNIPIKDTNYQKIDLSKAVLRASNSYNQWGHGSGNLYNGDTNQNLFIAVSSEEAEYYKRFKDTEEFENKCDEYLKIRFNGTYKIDCMRFQAWYAGSGMGVPNNYTIETSLDGDNWQQVYECQSQDVSSTGWYQCNFEMTECKYARIRFNSVVEACDVGYCPALKELEFYGVPVSIDGLDLSDFDGVTTPAMPTTYTETQIVTKEIPGEEISSGQGITNANNNSVKTGDSSNALLVVGILIISCASVLSIFVYRKKGSNKKSNNRN